MYGSIRADTSSRTTSAVAVDVRERDGAVRVQRILEEAADEPKLVVPVIGTPLRWNFSVAFAEQSSS